MFLALCVTACPFVCGFYVPMLVYLCLTVFALMFVFLSLFYGQFTLANEIKTLTMCNAKIQEHKSLIMDPFRIIDKKKHFLIDIYLVDLLQIQTEIIQHTGAIKSLKQDRCFVAASLSTTLSLHTCSL